MLRKSQQVLITLVNVLYWNILSDRRPKPSVFKGIEPDDAHWCGTYEPWSAAVFELACAFYALVVDLGKLCKFTGEFKTLLTKTPEVRANTRFIRVSAEQTVEVRKDACRRTKDARESVATMMQFESFERAVQEWMIRIKDISCATRDAEEDRLFVNVIGSLLVLQSYQDKFRSTVALYDFASDAAFSDAVLNRISGGRICREEEAQTQYTNINAERREPVQTYATLLVKRFDARPPPFLDANIYSGAHLCLAVWHPASRSWLKVRVASERGPETAVETMYDGDEYIACIRGDAGEDMRVYVSPPEAHIAVNDVWIQAYHIYTDVQGDRRANKHSIAPHRVAGFMLLEVTGSCNIKTHTLIGPVKTSFSKNNIAPATAEGKDVEIDVDFYDRQSGGRGEWKVAQVLTTEERKTLNAYNERLFVSIMALNRREARENNGATALAQNNPYVFLPAAVMSRVPKNLLSLDVFESMIKRALRRLDMDTNSLSYYLKLAKTNTWGVRRLREIVHMLFVDFAMVSYDTDRINKTQLEQMMPVSVTGSGDCEDGAIVIYQMLVSLRRIFLLESKRSSTPAYNEFIKHLCMEYVPAVCNFRANANSHGVAHDTPAGKTVSHNAAILIPITETTERIALPIVLETTGVASISTVVNADEELSFAVEGQAKAAVEHIALRKKIRDKLAEFGFEGFNQFPMSPSEVDRFYDYSQYICSTEFGGHGSTSLRFDHDFQKAARQSLATPISGELAADEPSSMIDMCAVFIPPKQIHFGYDKPVQTTHVNVAYDILSRICKTAQAKNTMPASKAFGKNVSHITPRATTFFLVVSDYTEEQIVEKVEGAVQYVNSMGEHWDLSVTQGLATVLYIELFVDHGQH